MIRVRMLALVGLMVLGTAVTAMSGTFEIPESVLMSPKQFEGYTPKKGDVTFNHASHMDIACQQCHHTVADSFTIQSCMSEGCHDNAKDRTTANSLYNAFHTTAICSATRQALLTGRNHHSCGMGGITDILGKLIR